MGYHVGQIYVSFDRADWVDWARTHNVPWFGTVVDTDLRAQFLDLGMGVQPTEETLDSSGVKEFHGQVIKYLEDLGIPQKSVMTSRYLYR